METKPNQTETKQLGQTETLASHNQAQAAALRRLGKHPAKLVAEVKNVFAMTVGVCSLKGLRRGKSPRALGRISKRKYATVMKVEGHAKGTLIQVNITELLKFVFTLGIGVSDLPEERHHFVGRIWASSPGPTTHPKRRLPTCSD